jgi:hypothetical protein
MEVSIADLEGLKAQAYFILFMVMKKDSRNDHLLHLGEEKQNLHSGDLCINVQVRPLIKKICRD